MGICIKNASQSLQLTFEEIQHIAGIPIDHLNITDITDYVRELDKKRSIGEDIDLLLPKEQVYIVQ